MSRPQPLVLSSGVEHNWPWRRPALDFTDPSTLPPFPGLTMGEFPLYEARVMAMNPAPPFGGFYWRRR